MQLYLMIAAGVFVAWMIMCVVLLLSFEDRARKSGLTIGSAIFASMVISVGWPVFVPALVVSFFVGSKK